MSSYISHPLEGDDEEELKEGTRIKILTPNRLLTRLSLLVAQIKAENNSCKLKTKIGQIVYLLYQSLKHFITLDLRGLNKHVCLQKFFIYYTWKNIRQQYKNNKLKIVAPMWNDEFELPDGSYSVSDMEVSSIS